MSQKTAIYPGTFDPITNGHLDIALRAATLFDKLIIAVADNKNKAVLFSVDERVRLASMVVSAHKNIEVKPFSSLLVDFAKKEDASILVRGLRVMSDFEYEFQLAGMNHSLSPTLETIFLPTRKSHAFLSSSLVKEVSSLGGDVTDFVPDAVFNALKEKKKNA